MATDVFLQLVFPSPSLQIVRGILSTEASDDENLQRFARILHGLDKSSTFDALSEAFAGKIKWCTDGVYDTVNPFGDHRQRFFNAAWTFDIGRDTLLHTNRDGRRSASLGLLREHAIKLTDMSHLGPPFPFLPKVKLDGTYWKPLSRIDARVRTFVHRILRDFDHRWRHILRDEYNCETLRRLARAIVRLSALDFNIHEENQFRHINSRFMGECVGVLRLPAWEPFESNSDTVLPGAVRLVLCQNIYEGLLEAQQHASSQQDPKSENSANPRYLILSVKHIVLGRSTKQYGFEHTAPEQLLNGNPSITPPSELALDYIIWATAAARKVVSTPLQKLPVEIQDMILGHASTVADAAAEIRRMHPEHLEYMSFGYVSKGTVVTAQMGCLLDIGSPFLWKDGHLNVTSQEYYRFRSIDTPVESTIQFDGQTTGLVYKGGRLP